jgi:preprotein translocase subunit SecD
VGNRNLGLAAAVAAVLVAWLAFRAAAPDLGYELAVAWSDLDAAIELTPVVGSPNPLRVAELLRQRLRHADLTGHVVVDGERVRVLVSREDEAQAMGWVVPQGDLQLLIVSGLQGAFREAQARRVRERKAAGTYDPLVDAYDLHPHPQGQGEVLLERVLRLPQDGITGVTPTRDAAGRPALDLQLSGSGYTVAHTLGMQAQGRALAAVLDGRLLSLNHATMNVLGSLVVDAGPDAYDAALLDRMVTLIRTRLPAPMTTRAP